MLGRLKNAYKHGVALGDETTSCSPMAAEGFWLEVAMAFVPFVRALEDSVDGRWLRVRRVWRGSYRVRDELLSET